MLVIALTGGIGSGKSLAGEYFGALGAIVIDSDQLARDVIERGSPGFDEIVLRFGDQILSNGEIDRKKLAEIVFADPKARLDLEAITHPRIREAFEEVVKRAPQESIIINQIPLLVETQGKYRFDRVIVITAPESLRRERLLKRGLGSADITRRISAQVSDELRMAQADFVITNDGDNDHLLRQVEQLWFDELIPQSTGQA